MSINEAWVCLPSCNRIPFNPHQSASLCQEWVILSGRYGLPLYWQKTKSLSVKGSPNDSLSFCWASRCSLRTIVVDGESAIIRRDFAVGGLPRYASRNCLKPLYASLITASQSSRGVRMTPDIWWELEVLRREAFGEQSRRIEKELVAV